jgi:peptidyl-prolyl cis-trans isomerase D
MMRAVAANADRRTSSKQATMLRGIHKASANWLGKTLMAVLLGLIAVSFAIWGIGDIFRGFGRSTVAKIGNTEITVEQFRQYYSDQLQRIGRQLRRPISQEQARALGLDRQLIGQMLAEHGLDERARQLGLAISDEEIARKITTDPAFQGLTGRFDRARFEQIIRGAGYTEPRFVAEQRRIALRRQISETLTAGLVAPKTAVEAILRYQTEERAIEYVVLGREQAGDVPPPTPEAIAKYFEERKILFRAPEYRKIVIVELTPQVLGKTIEVDDADIKRAYEDRRDRYVTPERRQVLQIVFPTLEEAQAAADRIAKGLTFSALAAERGLKEPDIDLGLVTRAAMVDRAIADAAFALKQGEVSAPVQGRFGTALVQVVKNEPEQVKSFAEAAPEIRQQLAAERAKAEVLKLHDKIEDERAGGSNLAELAQKLNIPARTIEAVDRSGRAPDGKAVAGIPETNTLLDRAFSSNIGVESDPLHVADGGFVWFDVAGITPTRERTLDEVKDQVETRLRDEEIARRLRAKADDVIEKLKGNGSLADIAKADGLKLEKAEGIRRVNAPTGIPPKVVDAVFSTGQAAAASVEGATPMERFVFRVTDVKVPQLDMASQEAKRTEEILRRAYAEDIFNEYVAQLGVELGVTINQSALNQVVGGTAN